MVYQSTEIERIQYLVIKDTGPMLVLRKENGVLIHVDLDTTESVNAAVAQAVTDLIAGAPGALNTLNELATALGDDANFASTISTALANRASILPTVGNYTYDSSQNLLTDPDGNTYTYNLDGSLNTQTRGGITRTYHWNPDGTLGSVS